MISIFNNCVRSNKIIESIIIIPSGYIPYMYIPVYKFTTEPFGNDLMVNINCQFNIIICSDRQYSN